MAESPKDDELFEALHPWERSFREQMKLVRERQGMNQTDLARRMADRGFAFHQQTVQRIEQGLRPVRLNEAMVLANILELSLDSMTTPMQADERDIVWEVERARRECSEIAENASVSRAELADKVGTLALYVHDRLNTYSGEDDPLLKFAFDWLVTFDDIDTHLRNVEYFALCAAEGKEIIDFAENSLSVDVSTWEDVHPELLGTPGVYPSRPERASDAAEE